MPRITINHRLLDSIINDAKAKAEGTRWESRIDDAVNWLIAETVVDTDDAGNLFVPSSSIPGLTYRAGKQCQCKAFERGIPCVHRAASRLVARMVEQGGVTIATRRNRVMAEVQELFA